MGLPGGLDGVKILESESEVAQLCLTLCDPMDCSLLDSSVHGIFQTRVLEWVAISFSRGSSPPRDQTRSPALQADALQSVQPGKQTSYIYFIMFVNLFWVFFF